MIAHRFIRAPSSRRPSCLRFGFTGSDPLPRVKWFILATAAMLGLMMAMASSCIHVPVARIDTEYWISKPNGQIQFPEQDTAGPVWHDLRQKDNIGICFSGGGTRSATATIGQLRALRKLGILSRTRYISSVSGGAWASTPYTYLPESAMDGFLGEYTPPGELTSESFLHPADGSMCKAITEAAITARILRNLLLRNRGSESYSSTIADRFLRPFGLAPAKTWFTWSDETAQDILQRNPVLRQRGLTNYHAVPDNRPFLIVGGTIRHYNMFNWQSNFRKRVPLEITPLYTGVRPYYPPGEHFSKPIGGGYVESFAYDSMHPEKTAENRASADLYKRLPFNSTEVMTLADVVGVSGAAPGEFAISVDSQGLPKYNYWSPLALDAYGRIKSARYSQQDGGLSENLGILALLARRTEKIIAFANAEEKVILGKGFRFPDYIESLFGVHRPEMDAKMYRYNGTQVFDPESLSRLEKTVRASVAGGGPATAFTTLNVRPNERFGVPPYQVKIYWVFLDAETEGPGAENGQSASQNWINRIPRDSPVARMLENRPPELERFPNYRTFSENRGFRLWYIIKLKEEQTTLLAHYSAWTIASREKRLLEFLGSNHPPAANRKN